MIALALTTTWRAGGRHPDARPRMIWKLASTVAEHRQACRLVFQSYLTTDLIEPNQFGMRVTRWHLLPTTSMFVALEAGRVIGTVTLIGDAGLGLPMESVYAAEVEAASAAGLYAGEVSCLATRDTEFKEFLLIFVSLTRLTAQQARTHGMDQFLIAIHPKHARLYEKFMGFEQIGSLTEYPSVNNAPAVACCLDFARIDRHRPACWERFFGTPVPAADLAPVQMIDEEPDYFGPMTEFSEQTMLTCAYGTTHFGMEAALTPQRCVLGAGECPSSPCECFSDRGKLPPALAGVVFAIVLVNVQGGLYFGLMRKASVFTDHCDADLWIGHRLALNSVARSLPARPLSQAISTRIALAAGLPRPCRPGVTA